MMVPLNYQISQIILLKEPQKFQRAKQVLKWFSSKKRNLVLGKNLDLHHPRLITRNKMKNQTLLINYLKVIQIL